MSAEVLVESRGDNHYDWAENQAERAPQVRRKRVNSEEDRPVASFNVRGNDDRGFGFRAPVKRIALRIYPGASRRRSLLHCDRSVVSGEDAKHWEKNYQSSFSHAYGSCDTAELIGSFYRTVGQKQRTLLLKRHRFMCIFKHCFDFQFIEVMLFEMALLDQFIQLL